MASRDPFDVWKAGQRRDDRRKKYVEIADESGAAGWVEESALEFGEDGEVRALSEVQPQEAPMTWAAPAKKLSPLVAGQRLKGLSRSEEDMNYVTVNPDQMYPEMLSYLRDNADAIKETLSQSQADWINSSLTGGDQIAIMALTNNGLVRRAAQLDPAGYQQAMSPYSSNMPKDVIDARSEWLEVARLWYTELVRREIGQKLLTLNISRSDRWKLGGS